MPLLENFERQGNYLFKHRGIMPLVIIIPGLAIVLNSRFALQDIFQTQWHRFYELFCLLICMAGLFIRSVTVGHVPAGTSGRNTANQVADHLNTKGMYSVVRHPLYLANYLMWLGICLRTYNFWYTIIVSLFFWIYYERIMFAEEQYLRKKYGSEYLEWASRTPAFIPNLSLWKPWESRLNYRKIFRQEKTGLLVIFFMFWIIEAISEWDFKNRNFNESYWTAGLVASIVFYITLKVLEKKTNLLSDPVV